VRNIAQNSQSRVKPWSPTGFGLSDKAYMLFTHNHSQHNFYFEQSRQITTAFILLLLSACTSQPTRKDLLTKRPIPVQTRAWECERNFAFVSREEGKVIWLFLPDHAVQLPRTGEANGATSFRGTAIVFRQHGGQAWLELPDASYEHCRNNVERAARETAKLDGVDFQASGHAPDWVLDITLDGDMRLSTGPDHTRYTFRTPDPIIIESERETLYSTQNRAHQVIVELSGVPCRDTTSGETREVTVNISLDDRRLKGCGSALH